MFQCFSFPKFPFPISIWFSCNLRKFYLVKLWYFTVLLFWRYRWILQYILIQMLFVYRHFVTPTLLYSTCTKYCAYIERLRSWRYTKTVLLVKIANDAAKASLPRHLRVNAASPPRHLRDIAASPPRHYRVTSASFRYTLRTQCIIKHHLKVTSV